jgi:hypothetical protein
MRAPLVENRAPNFVLLDYVNIGEAFQAAANLPSTSTSATSTATRSASATKMSSGHVVVPPASIIFWITGFFGLFGFDGMY